jgi:hypothetical protein
VFRRRDHSESALVFEGFLLAINSASRIALKAAQSQSKTDVQLGYSSQ